MRYWGMVVAVLYALILMVLLMPLAVLIISGTQPVPGAGWWQEFSGQIRESFFSGRDTWSVWVYLGVLVLAQAALLSVPVKIAEKRPVTKRTIIPLVASASFMMGLLAAGAALAVNETVRRGEYDTWSFAVILAVSLLMWLFWARVFFLWSRKTEAAELVRRQCRYLLKGSILELLIAVPAHILARHRDYCCAGAQTFIGISFGISVMLFAFGPGVFFLFARRHDHARRRGCGTGAA